MPGFVFLSRKVELLGVKIIEFILRNVLPVLNFSKDETFLKEYWSNRQRKKYTVNTIPFQIYSIFFFALYKLTWDVASYFPFSLKGERKRFLFYNQSFFCNQSYKIHSIPQVFTESFAVDFRDHLRSRIICGPFWGSFAVLGSFAVGDHLGYCTDLSSSLWEMCRCYSHWHHVVCCLDVSMNNASVCCSISLRFSSLTSN